MARGRRLVVAGAAVLATFGTVLAGPAQAATLVVANWQMNEAPGTAAMKDSSGNGIAGGVGNDVLTGVQAGGATAYRFSRLMPDTPPALPSHNVIVATDDRLQPAGRTLFTVEVRMRTGNKFGNLVQKGQATTKGGYWKIQLPQAEPSCLFRGPGGVTNAVRARGLRLNDNAWHVIRCEATPTQARLYVDGVLIGRDQGTTGRIANNEVLSIGGKTACDQITTTCDYFGGDVDYVRVQRSST